MARYGVPQWPNPERIEDVRQVHEAMEACGGDLEEAARLLKIRKEKLHKTIHNSPDLRARWTESKRLPADAAENDKMVVNGLPMKADDEVADVLRAQETALRTGLHGLGIAGQSIDLAVGYQHFAGQHYTSSLKIIAGGLLAHFLDLQKEFNKLTAELDAGGREMPVLNRETGKIDRQFVPLTSAREGILRDDRAKIAEQMQRVSDRANKALYTQAIVKNRIEGRTKKARPKGFLDLSQAKPVQSADEAGPAQQQNE